MWEACKYALVTMDQSRDTRDSTRVNLLGTQLMGISEMLCFFKKKRKNKKDNNKTTPMQSSVSD